MEINKKELEKILNNQREQYQRYIKILHEDFGSKLKVVGEGIMGINESLTAIREMVAKNTEDITIIKSDISFIKQELKAKVDLDEFAALEKRVILLENKLKRI